MGDGQIGTSRILSEIGPSALCDAFFTRSTLFDVHNYIVSGLLRISQHRSRMLDARSLRRARIRCQIWQDSCCGTEG